MRGGDYHKSIQHDVIISGKMEFLFKDISWPYSLSLILEPGESIYFIPGDPHLLIAKEDTLSIEWLEGESELNYYPPYRKMIENE